MPRKAHVGPGAISRGFQIPLGERIFPVERPGAFLSEGPNDQKGITDSLFTVLKQAAHAGNAGAIPAVARRATPGADKGAMLKVGTMPPTPTGAMERLQRRRRPLSIRNR